MSNLNEPHALLLAAGALSALFLLLQCSRLTRKSRNPCHLPPGPKSTPILGNIKDMPSKEEWKTYSDWAQKYGDIVYVHTLGRPIIFLNSFETARDLLDKRSSIYSDRVQPPMLVDLSSLGWNFGLMPYTAKWRTYRRLFTEHFQSFTADRFRPIQEQEIHRSLKRLIEYPQNIVEHARYTAGAIILRISYGIQMSLKNDPMLALVVESNEAFSRCCTPGAWLVDTIPILKYVPRWMPGVTFKRLAADCKALQYEMRTRAFDLARQAWKERTMSPCAAEGMLSALSQSDGSFADGREEMMRDCLGLAYAAGEDSTGSSLGTFFLAMVLFPDAQKKAQAEIDLIVGNARLPCFEDRPAMPYVEAVLKETLRFHPATPQGMPHRVMKDDTYKGYFIPKGSLIIPNVWHMFHNEAVWKDPETFRPERFLWPDAGKEATNSMSAAFGFGRRVCPGRHIAEETLWIGISCILAVFDITNALDSGGEPIIPDLAFKSGTLSGPLPFKCQVKPRSSAARILVEKATDGMS